MAASAPSRELMLVVVDALTAMKKRSPMASGVQLLASIDVTLCRDAASASWHSRAATTSGRSSAGL